MMYRVYGDGLSPDFRHGQIFHVGKGLACEFVLVRQGRKQLIKRREDVTQDDIVLGGIYSISDKSQGVYRYIWT